MSTNVLRSDNKSARDHASLRSSPFPPGAADCGRCELSAAIKDLRASHEATIRHLSKAVEMRDPTTHRHIDRIGALSGVLAGALGWPMLRIELLELAAPMHDVGKIGIPDSILLKPGQLTRRERELMQRHTVIGHEILSGSRSELLRLAAAIALSHHERLDGSGYPNQLRKEEIPQAARIVAVADVFDALMNDRCYRPALPLDEACMTMRAGRGSQFDPVVLDALFANLDEIIPLLIRG
jgi:HD-GYP domain-containing protein (c-di-GMP phosphodiesterase class II)